MPEKSIKDFIEAVIPYAGFSVFGGIAFYLHGIRNGREFNITFFLINIILSAFVGIMVFTFLPIEMGNIKVGIIGVSGYLSNPILTLLEKKGLDLFIKKFLGLSQDK